MNPPEIEIIDENELREINDLDINDQPDEDQATGAEGGEPEADMQDDDFTTENEPPEENAKLVFTRHKEAALTITLSKSGELVMSGGQDDVAYLWNSGTGRVLLECTGHKDSVVCVGFSVGEKYVASGDMSGLVQVWRVDTAEKVFEYETDDLQWMQWHPVLETVLLCGTESGNAWLLKINDHSQTKNYHGPPCANAAGRISKCGTKAVMGYDDGSVRLWDLKTGGVTINVKGNVNLRW